MAPLPPPQQLPLPLVLPRPSAAAAAPPANHLAIHAPRSHHLLPLLLRPSNQVFYNACALTSYIHNTKLNRPTLLYA